MKYIETIFENQKVQTLITENEELCDIATASLIQYNAFLEAFICSNLENYLAEGELANTYSNITETVIAENIAFMQACSSIMRSELENEEKAAVLEAFSDPEVYLSFVSEGMRMKMASAQGTMAAYGDMVKRWLKQKGINISNSTGKLGKIINDKLAGENPGGKINNSFRSLIGRKPRQKGVENVKYTKPENLDRAGRADKITGGIAATTAGLGLLGGAGVLASDKDK